MHSSLIAFFAKTSPPIRSRRLVRYRLGQNCPSYQKFRYLRLLTFSSNWRCYECRQLSHVQINFFIRRKYTSNSTYFVRLGEVVSMMANLINGDDKYENMDALAEYLEEAETWPIDDTEKYPEFTESVSHLLRTLDENVDLSHRSLQPEPVSQTPSKLPSTFCFLFTKYLKCNRPSPAQFLLCDTFNYSCKAKLEHQRVFAVTSDLMNWGELLSKIGNFHLISNLFASRDILFNCWR